MTSYVLHWFASTSVPNFTVERITEVVELLTTKTDDVRLGVLESALAEQPAVTEAWKEEAELNFEVTDTLVASSEDVQSQMSLSLPFGMGLFCSSQTHIHCSPVFTQHMKKGEFSSAANETSPERFLGFCAVPKVSRGRGANPGDRQDAFHDSR